MESFDPREIANLTLQMAQEAEKLARSQNNNRRPPPEEPIPPPEPNIKPMTHKSKTIKLNFYDKTRIAQYNFVRNIDILAEVILGALFIAEGVVAAGLIEVGGAGLSFTRFVLHESIAVVIIILSLGFIPMLKITASIYSKDNKFSTKLEKFATFAGGLFVTMLCLFGVLLGPFVTFMLIANGTGEAPVVTGLWSSGDLFNIFHVLSNISYVLAGTYVLTWFHYILVLIVTIATPVVSLQKRNEILLADETERLRLEKEAKEAAATAAATATAAKTAADAAAARQAGELEEQTTNFIAANGFAPGILDPFSKIVDLKEWHKEAVIAKHKYHKINKRGISDDEKNILKLEKNIKYAELVAELTRCYLPKIDSISNIIFEKTTHKLMNPEHKLYADSTNKTGFVKLLLSLTGDPTGKSTSVTTTGTTNSSLINTRFETFRQSVEELIKFHDKETKVIPNDLFAKIIDLLIYNNIKVRSFLQEAKPHLTDSSLRISCESTDKPLYKAIDVKRSKIYHDHVKKQS